MSNRDLIGGIRRLAGSLTGPELASEKGLTCLFGQGDRGVLDRRVLSRMMEVRINAPMRASDQGGQGLCPAAHSARVGQGRRA